MIEQSLIVMSTLAIATVTTIIVRKILQHFITEYSNIIKVDPTNYSFKKTLQFLLFIPSPSFLYSIKSQS